MEEGDERVLSTQPGVQKAVFSHFGIPRRELCNSNGWSRMVTGWMVGKRAHNGPLLSTFSLFHDLSSRTRHLFHLCWMVERQWSCLRESEDSASAENIHWILWGLNIRGSIGQKKSLEKGMFRWEQGWMQEGKPRSAAFGSGFPFLSHSSRDSFHCCPSQPTSPTSSHAPTWDLEKLIPLSSVYGTASFSEEGKRNRKAGRRSK